MRRKQKKKFPKENLMVLFVAIIMISSTIGFVSTGSGITKQRYNDYKFSVDQTGTTLYWDNELIKFYNNPYQLENLNISSDIVDTVKGTAMVYLTFEANNTFPEAIDRVRFDLTNKFITYLGIYVVNGVTNNEAIPALPVIDCINSTSAVPVLKIETGDEFRIVEENSCIIFIVDNELDLMALEEGLLYRLLGVIND